MNSRKDSVRSNRTLSGWLRFGAAVTAVLVACPGCSLIFVKGPPEQPEKVPANVPIDCTSSRFAPVLDSLVGGYQVFRTGFALTAPDSAYSGSALNRPADIAIGLGLTALFVGSAVYGYSNTSKCDAANEIRSKQVIMPAQPVSSFLPATPAPATSAVARGPLDALPPAPTVSATPGALLAQDAPRRSPQLVPTAR